MKKNWILYVIGFLIGVALVRTARPFLVQDMALGYDPGLYKYMYELYVTIISTHVVWDPAFLDVWVQRMYPPFLGMLWSLQQILGRSSDVLVTWWVYILHVLVCCGVYALTKTLSRNRYIAVCACLVYVLSFVARFVFWFNYIKQLLWMFLLCMLLVLLIRKKWLLFVPVLTALFLAHRPAWVLAMMILCVYGMVLLFTWCKKKMRKWWNEEMAKHRNEEGDRNKTDEVKKWENEIMSISGKNTYTRTIAMLIVCVLVALWLAYPLYKDFLDLQVWRMIQPFFTTIDVPQFADTYKSWGSFLTTWDLIRTHWIVLLLSVFWVGVCMIQKPKLMIVHPLLFLSWLLWTWWVVGQLIFYQRMMGYANIFWCMAAWYGIYWLWTWGSEKMSMRKHEKTRAWSIVLWVYALKILIVFLLVFQWWIWYTWTDRMWRPWIPQAEFETIQNIDAIVEPDAVIIVPGIDYSPRVLWWSWRAIIAPGFYTLNQWWTVQQDWLAYRRDQDGEGKCLSLKENYGDLHVPLYVWIGNFQPIAHPDQVRPTYADVVDSLSWGSCFARVDALSGKAWSFWKVQ